MASTINSTDTGQGGLITTGDSSDELQLQTAETTALTIDSSQNVGIGTSSPASKLQVSNISAYSTITVTGNANNGGILSFVDSAGSTTSRILGFGSTSGAPDTSALRFDTNGAEAARFNSSGNLVFPNGQGIDFSASAGGGATSSLLDDYEEGTWTPTVFGGATSGTYTPSNIKAYYTKIGNQVTVWAGFGLSAASGGSGLGVIGGLPFNYKANSTGTGSVIAVYLNTSNATSNGIIIGSTTNSSSNQLYLALSIDNNVPEEISITAYSTSTVITFTYTYTVA